MLPLAVALEQRLTHPAAEAIVRAAQSRHLAIPDRGDSRYLLGLGVLSDVQGEAACIGSALLMARQEISLSPAALLQARQAGERGASSVFVARAGRAVGMISYADVVRPEVRSVLDRLRARGISEFVAEIVQRLHKEGHVVAMVGDGINDSPALANADVSISLKAGSDVARETADIVLHGDLHRLPEAVDLARQAVTLIRQNVGIVALPNALGMLGASAGFVGPLAATALNNGSSVVAALNALRPLVSSPNRKGPRASLLSRSEGRRLDPAAL